MSQISKLMVLFLGLSFGSALATVYQCPEQMNCVSSSGPGGITCYPSESNFKGTVAVPKEKTPGAYNFTGVQISSSGVTCNYILWEGSSTAGIFAPIPVQKKVAEDSLWGTSETQCGNSTTPIAPARCLFQDKKVSSNHHNINVAFNLKPPKHTLVK